MQSAGEVETLALLIDRSPHVHFAGVNLYPGHIWEAPQNQCAALASVSSRLAETLDRLRRAGLGPEVVSGGSTPTAYNSHQIVGLTEIRPGTYVFNDRNTVGVGACGWEQCALRVMVTVVSTAMSGRAIIDGGSKTSPRTGGSPARRPASVICRNIPTSCLKRCRRSMVTSM